MAAIQENRFIIYYYCCCVHFSCPCLSFGWRVLCTSPVADFNSFRQFFLAVSVLGSFPCSLGLYRVFCSREGVVSAQNESDLFSIHLQSSLPKGSVGHEAVSQKRVWSKGFIVMLICQRCNGLIVAFALTPNGAFQFFLIYILKLLPNIYLVISLLLLSFSLPPKQGPQRGNSLSRQISRQRSQPGRKMMKLEDPTLIRQLLMLLALDSELHYSRVMVSSSTLFASQADICYSLKKQTVRI